MTFEEPETCRWCGKAVIVCRCFEDGPPTDPPVNDEDPESVVKLLVYMNKKLDHIARVACLLEKRMSEGVIISVGAGAIETAKALFLLARAEELDDVLLAKGGRPATPATVNAALDNPLMGNAEPESHPNPDADVDLANPPKCPKCDVFMHLKRGVHGRFWACPNYRSQGCRETVDIDPKPWSDKGGGKPFVPPKYDDADGEEIEL